MQYIEAGMLVGKWTPIEIVNCAHSLWIETRSDFERGILLRLLCDKRMNYVWTQLVAEDRNKGGFLYPVKGGGGESLAQYHARMDVFIIAYRAVRDHRLARKWSEVETEAVKESERLLEESKMLRRRAVECAAAALINPAMNADVAALLREAEVSEEQARRALAEVMTPDDPMIIHNERGDRLARGVAAMIGRCKKPTGKPYAELYER
jgi:hypothetical protein